MKRKVFLIKTGMACLSIFFVQFLSAQNVAPYWSINGNNNALTTSKLGTTNAVPLRIMTKNTEWMRVDTLGRVGIGTTAPTQKLNVVGHVFITGNLGLGVTPTQKLHVSGNGIITGNLGLGVTPTQKLHVAGKAVFTDSVGIGTTTPAFRLDVRSATNCFGQFKATSGYAGVIIDKSAAAQNGYVVCRTAGVDKWTLGTMGNDNFSLRNGSIGADALTVNIADNNVGIGAISPSAKLRVSYPNGDAIWGESVDNFGAYFTSTHSYALVASSGGYAGVFYGSVWAANGYVTSDKNLKKDIQDFNDAMSIINKLKPANYLFKDDKKYASLHLPKGRHYGLLAQDLEQVLPNLVSEAPHELIDESKPATVVSATSDGKTQPIAAEPPVAGYLKQNNPNPLNDNTTIKYSTPNDARNAQIVVTDIQGSVLKTYRVPTGEGQLIIKKGELATGTYNYTLYVNNNKIDTKRMIVIR